MSKDHTTLRRAAFSQEIVTDLWNDRLSTMAVRPRADCAVIRRRVPSWNGRPGSQDPRSADEAVSEVEEVVVTPRRAGCELDHVLTGRGTVKDILELPFGV